MDVLIQFGADLELADDVGVTPLSVAAFLGSDTLVALLLEHGANYTRRDRVRNPLRAHGPGNRAVCRSLAHPHV